MTRGLEAASKALEGSDPVVAVDPESLEKSLPFIPSGSFVQDFLIGGRVNSKGVRPCPGWPRGRLSQIYGAPGAGKTTAALEAVAAVCATKGGTAAYVDYEHEVDLSYAKKIGVPIDDKSKFQLLQPDTMEDGFKLIIAMVSAGVSLIVIDSAGAGVPSVFSNKKLSQEGVQGKIGLIASMWSEFLPRLKKLISRTGTTVIGISQIRQAINASGPGGGPKSTVQGGEAWKFYASVRASYTVIEKVKGTIYNPISGAHEEQVIGAKVLVKLDKCKVSSSAHQTQVLYVISGIGFDNVRSLVDVCIVHKLIKSRGSWFDVVASGADEILPEGSSFNGKGALFEAITMNTKLQALLFKQMMVKIGTTPDESEAILAEAVEAVEGESFEDMMARMDRLASDTASAISDGGPAEEPSEESTASD